MARSGPIRWLTRCTSGDIAANAMSGTAPSTPSTPSLRPSSAPIDGSSGPTTVIAGRRQRATRKTVAASRGEAARWRAGAGTVRCSVTWSCSPRPALHGHRPGAPRRIGRHPSSPSVPSESPTSARLYRTRGPGRSPSPDEGRGTSTRRPHGHGATASRRRWHPPPGVTRGEWCGTPPTPGTVGAVGRSSRAPPWRRRRTPGGDAILEDGSRFTVTGTTAGSAATRGLSGILIPLALAQFICSFAGSNMNVMITAISEDLGTDVKGVQRAITLFLLVMAALMIPGGKLTVKFGRTLCLTLGLAVFGVGALIAAIAPGLGVLVLGYSILQGIGTALLIPPVYILTTMLFRDVTSRARAFGAISGMGGVGAAAGPLIGGLITTAISWRASFVFRALVIGFILPLPRRLEDPLPADPSRRPDTVGAVL